MCVVPEHPCANKYGYVMLHRVLMENKIGRLLEPYEVVHHLDHDHKNNDIDNLQIMTVDEHNAHHTKHNTKPPIELSCAHCGEVFYRKRNSVKPNKTGHYCSRSCNGKANAPRANKS